MVSGIGVFYPDKRPTQKVVLSLDQRSNRLLQVSGQGRDRFLRWRCERFWAQTFPLQRSKS